MTRAILLNYNLDYFENQMSELCIGLEMQSIYLNIFPNSFLMCLIANRPLKFDILIQNLQRLNKGSLYHKYRYLTITFFAADFLSCQLFSTNHKLNGNNFEECLYKKKLCSYFFILKSNVVCI